MPESRNGRWGHRARGSCCAVMARTAFAMLVVLLCAPAGAHAGVSDETRVGGAGGGADCRTEAGQVPERRDGPADPPSSIPLVTLGVFILWFGWFGFNGGSRLALGSTADAVAMSHVLVNTTLAGAAGVIAAIAVSRPILGRLDLLAGLNGAIAGLVSITAGPDIVEHYWAIVIGAVICTVGIKLLEKVRVDDVVGAVPAHLFAGAWGTLAASIVAGGSLGVQLLGVVAIGAFSFGFSWLLWKGLEKTVGVRVSPRVEHLGQDAAELGIEAYPEFVLMPEQYDEP